MENRGRRLSLKGEPIQVEADGTMADEEIDYLQRHLNYLFPDLDATKLVKAHTSKILAYNNWLTKHCIQHTSVSKSASVMMQNGVHHGGLKTNQCFCQIRL